MKNGNPVPLTLGLLAGLGFMTVNGARADIRSMTLAASKVSASEYDVAGLFTPGTDSSNTSLQVTTLQATLVYKVYDVTTHQAVALSDYSNIINVSFKDAGLFTVQLNKSGTLTTNVGSYAAYRFMGNTTGASTFSGNNIQFGTYDITISDPSKYNVQVFFSSAKIHSYGDATPGDESYSSRTVESGYRSLLLPTDLTSPTSFTLPDGTTGLSLFQPAAVPEASTYVMFALGLAPALLALRKRRQRLDKTVG